MKGFRDNWKYWNQHYTITLLTRHSQTGHESTYLPLTATTRTKKLHYYVFWLRICKVDLDLIQNTKLLFRITVVEEEDKTVLRWHDNPQQKWLIITCVLSKNDPLLPVCWVFSVDQKPRDERQTIVWNFQSSASSMIRSKFKTPLLSKTLGNA